MHELKLYEVQKKYKDKTAVKQVSYTFKHGVYGLLGENGAGKSTLMKILSGAYKRDSGEILIDGKPVKIDAGEMFCCSLNSPTLVGDLAAQVAYEIKVEGKDPTSYPDTMTPDAVCVTKDNIDQYRDLAF